MLAREESICPDCGQPIHPGSDRVCMKPKFTHDGDYVGEIQVHRICPTIALLQSLGEPVPTP